jgi:hypothetical protein
VDPQTNSAIVTRTADLIAWRLKLRDQEQDEWNEDNPFYWRFALQGRSVPPDTEERAAGFYERGEYEKGEAIFRLLVDCFDGYAEGYNYLGVHRIRAGQARGGCRALPEDHRAWAFDVIVMTTERFDEVKGVVGTIAHPAHRQGEVVYEAA